MRVIPRALEFTCLFRPPARKIDDRTIGEGKPGPVTKALQEAYFDVIRGRNLKHLNWLDYL